jgi:hypothetical protein
MTPAGPCRRLLVVLAAAACAAAPGCTYITTSRVWADTAMTEGRFSTEDHQWAYDGEPVAIELETDPGAVDFVLFGIHGDETVVSAPESAGRYRWTHVFHCGPEPRTYEVYASPFLIRGKCDWVYDRVKDRWEFYPGRSEQPDVQTARERIVKITCYRRTVRFRFAARGGPPREARLTLTRVDGGQTEVGPRGAEGARGLLVAGPGADGTCTVTYTPTHDEVNRAGTTHAELVVRHADGSTERLEQEIDTP